MVANFSHNTEFVTFSPKIFTMIFVCIYLRALRKGKGKHVIAWSLGRNKQNEAF